MKANMARRTRPKSTRQFLEEMLTIALGILVAGGVPARAGTSIVATGDPATDFGAIQDALDSGGEVILQNGPSGEVFNLEGVEKSLSITCDVILKGLDDTNGNMARVIANNFRTVPTPYGDVSVAMEVNVPGGTVELDNLDIETGAFWLIRLYTCKDSRLTNCKIKDVGSVGTTAFVTYEGLTGTGYFEDNRISCAWGIVDLNWSRTIFPSYEFHSNTIICPTDTCIALQAAKSVMIENNRFESPSSLYLAGVQGEITIKNNTVIQSGYQEYPPGSGQYNTYAISTSQGQGFSGGEISGNTIDMNPSEDVQLQWVPAICLADFEVFVGARGLLVQDNTIMGSGSFSIFVGHDSSNNIIRRNDFTGFTAVQHGPYGPCHICVGPYCHDNVCRDNIIGPVGPGEEAAGIWCAGDNNDFIRNDYTQSGIPGLTAGNIPCVRLTTYHDLATGDFLGQAENNLVFELDSLPPGTGAAEQVLDETSNTTNTIVGH
jgi:hypothetical protein